MIKACIAVAGADGVFRIAKVELVRAVGATLDCPLPPAIEALEPSALSA